MTYSLEPEVTRVTPFTTEGGALAAVNIAFGPLSVSTKLYKNGTGHFLSFPARRSEARDKWYDLVEVSDRALVNKALICAVNEYERHIREAEQMTLVG